MANSLDAALELAGEYPLAHNKREAKVIETATQAALSSDAQDAFEAILDGEVPETLQEAIAILAEEASTTGELKSVVATYDFSVDGGTIGDKLLGVTLPDNQGKTWRTGKRRHC